MPARWVIGEQLANLFVRKVGSIEENVVNFDVCMDDPQVVQRCDAFKGVVQDALGERKGKSWELALEEIVSDVSTEERHNDANVGPAAAPKSCHKKVVHESRQVWARLLLQSQHALELEMLAFKREGRATACEGFQGEQFLCAGWSFITST